LLDNPLWILVIAVTLALHVGFFVAVRRVMRDKPPDEPHDPE
jgi:uncharacterized protein YneF (UPF0154 family)